MIRHRATSPEAPASLPVSDDLLQEILLLLPPQPSSLPRASAVCKRWRRLATDPRFRRRFRVHHRKPPLLGVFEVRDVFEHGDMEIVFTPTLGAPDRIPPERFDLRRHGVETSGRSRAQLLGCRHGRVLLMDDVRKQILVCDPITGDHDRVDVPPEFRDLYGPGAVLCAASDQGHVHGSSCLSSPFKVVLMQPSCSEELEVHRSIACVYSSETGIWCNIISTDAPCKLEYANTGILVGDALYWTSASYRINMLLVGPIWLTNDIIEFDLDTQSLNVIKGPLGMNYSPLHQIVQAEDGAVGLALLSYNKYLRFQMWQRKVDCHGVSTWLLQKTLEMDNILGLRPQIERAMRQIEILGYNEDNGEIFVYADGSVYAVEHMSVQSRKLHTTRYINDYHPFTSFYTPGTTIAGGSNEAEMSHNM